MFVQIIQGKVNDVEALRAQLDRWEAELQPGATGYLGATSGVAEDGTFIGIVRFESEEAARANSDHPAQGEWWAETAKAFDGDARFRETSDVELLGGSGGSDDAGFVQVMLGTVTDRARLAAIEAELMPKIAELRPDVMGTVRCWFGDAFVHAIYFTSEAAAREGEANMAAASSASDVGAEMMSLVQDLTFIDLKDPWLRSA